MQSSRRSFVTAAGGVALSGLLSFPQRSLAQRGADDTERQAAELMSPQTQAAIDRGLTWLAERQVEDGSFKSTGAGRNVAVASLAGLAFLASGSTPGRGEFGGQLNRCVSYTLRAADDSGFISVREAATHGPMYEHGFATLFLAEVYGMSAESAVRLKLEAAVKLICSTQNHEGGWRYQPKPSEADISVTICQVMALRAARNAGIYVPNETIDRCLDFVKQCQNADGGFMYLLQGGESQFPRSAAGVVALYSAGVYEGNEIKKGLAYLEKHPPKLDDFQRGNHVMYGHYYAVQAMWQAGGEHWRKWYPAIQEALLRVQQAEGFWADFICPEYGTAMACLILQMPNNYLPIFQR